MLLQWCTVEPTGAGNLAAIRFSSPVRVQSIKIFPTGMQPFAQHPDIISRTEPQAFFLEVFFNAYHIASANSKEKPKATNALVPTMIAYPGGQMEFSVPMGMEYATRLMIVRGSFECVSMAIYGDIMAELPPPPTTYDPRPLPSIEPVPIAPVLDPSNSLDPTLLARQLLNVIPDAPSLPLAIRLVFCLKPPSDDWDLPEFPYLHPDFDNDTADFDLEKAFRLTTRPVSDDVQDDTLLRFAENVAKSIRGKDSSEAYLVAGILAHAASQHPNMANFLLEKLDLPNIFDSTNMDELTLIRLRDAATNADIARRLNEEWFLQTVNGIAQNPHADKETQTAAMKLVARIQDWAVFEDSLSNTQGDFAAAAAMLKELGTDEASLGIWLASMVTHDDLIAVLSENPLMPIPLPHPPYLFSSLKSSLSHDAFVAFLRAFIGVAAVLAVYAFADAFPHKLCRERALAIIRLWQGVNGYREIVNHMLLLKQMTFRLECMMEDDPPRRAGLDAEHILVNLAKDPHAILQPDLVKCVLSLRAPHAFITEEEEASMHKAAIVAEDGLFGAIDEFMSPVDRPLTLTNLRMLRVALAVINQELDNDNEQRVLEEFWKEGSCSLLAHLVDIFVPISEEIEGQFSIHFPERRSQELMTQLFRAADEVLKLLLRLLPVYPPPVRSTHALTSSVADLFACTDAADMLYSQSSPACVAAQETRQSCIDTVRTLSDPSLPAEGGKLGAEIVLKTLLEHGLHCEDRDPVHHLVQTFCLIDYLLPMPDVAEGQLSVWTQRVMPVVLRELWAFCRALDTENKVHFVKRLTNLDRGVVGVGEWLLLEELKDLLHALKGLEDPSLPLRDRAIRSCQVSMSMRFLLDVVSGASTTSKVCRGCLTSMQDASSILSSCLLSIYAQRVTAPALTELMQVLAREAPSMDDDLHSAVLLMLVQSAQNPELDSASLVHLLEQCIAIYPATSNAEGPDETLQQELGILIASLNGEDHTLDTAIAEQCVFLLERLTTTSSTLRGLTRAFFMTFCDRLRDTLGTEWHDRIASISEHITIAEDTSRASPVIPLSETVELSMHDVEELLRHSIPPPSTPPRKALNQDVLGLVTVSPPAIIRSPATTGLTKTYNNNDFRQLRQTPSARQNTSRLPSMHVDVGVAMVT
ncbi:uncharacterized protein LAESUDRAFT_655713 [Laetiporus sulphureus 93-53]|uniref:Uncharacterized protein n=1 Tax=Laetiporus sulphureus 93-53 TaxID=1314785 RepID=A0A165DTZ6_9APHY|nr:uncharacterized protein LAESUDRAFT_655713 [Laetiporus sulphureus 93-53]KZT05628.1 hypothetical protein LAESUDRAFT_655713 [Laetiporus sulphureus 93-53]